MNVPGMDFEQRIRSSFARQSVMATIGASLRRVESGVVAIGVPFRGDLCQQHGFLHAGVMTTIVDSACGYAALSLMQPGDEVLTVEFKVNFLLPATGADFIATGHVVRAGRRVSVCTGEVKALTDAGEKIIAIMQTTMACVSGRAGASGASS